MFRKTAAAYLEPLCKVFFLFRKMEEEIPGATSLSDLRAANSDPFNKVSRIKRFFLDDSFRAICIGFALSSLALTVIMIFDANLGKGMDSILC